MSDLIGKIIGVFAGIICLLFVCCLFIMIAPEVITAFATTVQLIKEIK